MKHAKPILVGLAAACVFALVAFGDRCFPDLVTDTPVRRAECRDQAVLTHRHCDKSPEVCDRIARDALDLCMGGSDG